MTNIKYINTSTRVQDYDSNLEYDYRKYWKDREYENQSERNVISKLLKNDYSFIDIGGGYGRLTDLYQDKYKYSILFDYSLSNLKKAENKEDVFKVCGDIYNMPFKDGTISSGMLVRVLHHIENPEKAISEISRVISDSFILEFANKNHILSRVKHFKDRDFKKQDIYKIPHRNDSQGFMDDQIFLNFSPSYIFSTLEKNNFLVKKTISASNFRHKYFKKLFSVKSLVFLDNTFKLFFSKIYFGPSIFLLLEKKNKNVKKEYSIEDILRCPKCIEDIKNGKCVKCKKNYLEDGIYNFK
ncbi:methyltransferase domain-containing protein [Patescibacteria group bacterium]|nr:methyltransferase domain-containing protein [Patescibacteria group bacterium]